MKRGDRFGILAGPGNWLYCSYRGMDGPRIHGDVINGSWSFYFDPSSGVATFSDLFDTTVMTGWQLAYTGPFPKDIADYNEAIAFMEEQVKRPYAVRKFALYRYKLSMFLFKLRRSWEAFRDEWTGKTRKYEEDAKWEDEDDDSIPF